MHRTKRKAHCGLLVVMFIFTMVLSPIAVAPVSAVTIDDAVTQINDVYQYLDANNKDAMQAARTNLKSTTVVTQEEWTTILTPFLTDDAKAKYGEDGTDTLEVALKQVLLDVGDLYYSTNSADLKTNITTYKEANRATFERLFGTEIGFDDLFQLIMDMRTELPKVIDSTEAGLLANDTNEELERKMPIYFKEALVLATSEEYSNNIVFKGKLTDIGWSTDKLVDAKTALAAQIDPSKDAELAVALAAIRSKTVLSTVASTEEQPNSVTGFTEYASTDTVNAYDAEGRRIAGVVTNTLAPGTLNFQVKIMDKNLDANYVNWSSNDSNVVEVTQDTNGNPVLTAKNTGTACITIYRYINGGTTTPENDWLLKFDVTVEGGGSIAYGDLNGDNNITVADAVLVVQIALGNVSPTANDILIADVNGDHNVTVADAVDIVQRALGNITKFIVEP